MQNLFVFPVTQPSDIWPALDELKKKKNISDQKKRKIFFSTLQALDSKNSEDFMRQSSLKTLITGKIYQPPQ